jgi:hypothetical protein
VPTFRSGAPLSATARIISIAPARAIKALPEMIDCRAGAEPRVDWNLTLRPSFLK